MTTLDFELEIGPGVEGSYPVVARAPTGEVATTLRWSVTPAELDHQLALIKDKVLVSSAVVRRVSTEDEQPVRELGQRLFEALIADHVLALYVTSRQRARENGEVLRLVPTPTRQELRDPPAAPLAEPRIFRHPSAVQTLLHRRAVNAVVFSPDGRRLATASDDMTARIWVLSDDE